MASIGQGIGLERITSNSNRGPHTHSPLQGNWKERQVRFTMATSVDGAQTPTSPKLLGTIMHCMPVGQGVLAPHKVTPGASVSEKLSRNEEELERASVRVCEPTTGAHSEGVA